MPYLGNIPAENYASFDKQTITGDGGTSYTLTHPVGSAQEVAIFVNNVRQEPGVAYTVTGTALTMTGNVESTDDFYAIFIGKAVQTVEIPEKATNGDYDFDNGTLFVDASTNRVGVNTTAPDTPLDVEGHIRVTGGSDCDIEFQSGSARRKFIGGDVNNLELGTYSSSNTSRDVHMVIASSGYVGINNDSPQYNLSVDCGAPSSADKTIANFQSESSRQVGFVWDDSQSTMGVATLTNHPFCVHINGNSNEKFRIHTDGIAKFKSANNVGRIMTGGSVSIADDSSITLTNATAGAVAAMIYESGSGNGALVFFSYSGTPTIVTQPGISSFATSDTDGKFCIIGSAGAHLRTFKNRAGSTKTFNIFLIGGDVRP